MIRLIASDLDGTLLNSAGEVSARTAAAVQAAEAAGLIVVFVTGRPPRWLGSVAAATGHTGLAICSNGALVYDLHREEVVEAYAIPVEVARSAVSAVRSALPSVTFGVETAHGHRQEEPGVELIKEPVAKLLVRSASLDSDALLAAVRDVLGDTVEATHSWNGPGGLVEISAAGVTKATSLARFCGERGITADEVVAIGDMPNDLPMLAWAGTAYAVANAHPEVLAAVGQSTASNDEDGVAQVLVGVLV
ncbi:hypothetical protein EV189_0553 [Motilibacter rhizosphaerae]|uniref:HAD superfamily hydrolase (TIGR01484 family) n=1 Tax=Motilibacter rhizosphaerae TaxID=598652 RepID=A0A4Q7NVV0_9ACTN|nr:HAD family hydrolase [Motilibacter rhizosphaerae]RZS91315.1 hypothetical protein EV189_0553 [Motilibacter rhizosphaerae]